MSTGHVGDVRSGGDWGGGGGGGGFQRLNATKCKGKGTQARFRRVGGSKIPLGEAGKRAAVA